MNSTPGAGRTILSVVGPHSGCGKTMFITLLLRHVGGFSCLKVSPACEAPGPVAAGGAGDVQTFYFEDGERLRRPGTDTALYLAAGAVHVERLRCRPGAIGAGLAAALGRLPASAPIVVESSSAAALLDPVAVVLVARPPIPEMKPSTRAILPRVTDFVVFHPGAEGRASAEAEHWRRIYTSLQPRFVWLVNLSSVEPHHGMVERMRSLLAC